MAAETMFRKDVLQLYRRIFRIARKWQATIPAETEAERKYIRDEARKSFHRYKNITKPAEIMLHIFEADSRIVIALDFGTPYLDKVISEFNKLPTMSNRNILAISLMQDKKYLERLKKLAR